LFCWISNGEIQSVDFFAYEPVSGRFWRLTQMLVLRNHVFSIGPIYAFGVFLPFIKAAVRDVSLLVVEQGEL
jgi:hypothetical protein